MQATPHQEDTMEMTDSRSEALAAYRASGAASTTVWKPAQLLGFSLPAPVLGMAGYGVPAPDGGDYLSDGYETPELAAEAAQRAYQLELRGVDRDTACLVAARQTL